MYDGAIRIGGKKKSKFMDKVKESGDKAKEQFEKNRHKVAPLVDKATDQVDKVTKGKSRSVTKHVDSAARKLSGPGGTTTTSTGAEIPDEGPVSDDAQGPGERDDT